MTTDFAALAEELEKRIAVTGHYPALRDELTRAADALREAERLAWLPDGRDTGSHMEEYRHWGNTGFNNCLAAIRQHRENKQ